MSDDEFLRNQREMFFDRQYDASLESVAEQVQADLSPDAAVGGTGGGAMEDELLGTDDPTEQNLLLILLTQTQPNRKLEIF